MTLFFNFHFCSRVENQWIFSKGKYAFTVVFRTVRLNESYINTEAVKTTDDWCVGSVIAPTWIVTVASCLPTEENTIILIVMREKSFSDVKEIYTEHYYPHQLYEKNSSNEYYYDVGLIETRSRLKFSDYLHTVRMSKYIMAERTYYIISANLFGPLNFYTFGIQPCPEVVTVRYEDSICVSPSGLFSLPNIHMGSAVISDGVMYGLIVLNINDSLFRNSYCLVVPTNTFFSWANERIPYLLSISSHWNVCNSLFNILLVHNIFYIVTL